ncbi:MAG: flagellar FliJ family protein [Anaerolineales bacterium]|nr:flagellar FliJ family protein [Anaerolineales bacterium]
MTPKFSLQPVLDYRETRVEILEIELGRLVQSQLRGKTFLEALQSSRNRLLEEMGKQQVGDVDLFMLSRLRSNLQMVNQRIAEQEARLAELAQQIAEKQVEIVVAKQDAEALNKLKEQEIERYRKEEVRRENRLQDDIYNSRAFRQTKGAA